MKKTVRLIALAILSVLFVSMLTSCNMLDEMKENRVDVLEEDGTIMEYKGTKYKFIDVKSRNRVNYCRDYNLVYAEKDVPLLVREQFGRLCTYCEHSDILIKNSYTAEEAHFYCTLDKYEEYCKALLSELTHYKFEYRALFEDTRRVVSYMLDEELNGLINATLERGATEEVQRDDIYSTWQFFRLDKCDANDLVEQKEAVNICIDPFGHFGIVFEERKLDEGTVEIKIGRFPEEYTEKLSQLYNTYIKTNAQFDYTY